MWRVQRLGQINPFKPANLFDFKSLTLKFRSEQIGRFKMTIRSEQRLGPYRKQRGEKTLRVDAFPGPRWFRYGALKEAFSVWHERAMCFECAEPADRVFGS
jgi:hypothetical protein